MKTFVTIISVNSFYFLQNVIKLWAFLEARSNAENCIFIHLHFQISDVNGIRKQMLLTYNTLLMKSSNFTQSKVKLLRNLLKLSLLKLWMKIRFDTVWNVLHFVIVQITFYPIFYRKFLTSFYIITNLYYCVSLQVLLSGTQ